MKRAALGMVRLALVAALLAGLGMVGAGVQGYAKGKRAATLERNVHWQGVVDKLQADAHAALQAAEDRTRAVEETNRLRRQGADDEQERERAATRAALAAVAADRDRLRQQLAAAATGGVQAADDSVAACRDRAEALGGVLADALRAHAECTAEAEDLAAGVRALRAAWPVNEPPH